MSVSSCIAFSAAAICLAQIGICEVRTERFDADPQWEAYNNRSTAVGERTITQRFGYSNTQNTGGTNAGEIGGLISPAAEPAYYAKVIPTATFNDKLSASGTLACTGSGRSHVLIGFFNTNTLNEWRTPNTIALRIQGRGDVFFAYVEYATGRWRAGADSPGGFATVVVPSTGTSALRGFQTSGTVHRWSIAYDPDGNGGSGNITVRIDDEEAVCHLDPGHRQDGAEFNRFGILPVMKQWDDPGELWLDDITVNGESEDFSSDPNWDSSNNRRTYVSTNVRPRFDFGYSRTQFAKGATIGELGGLVFRGDIRNPDRMAYYGDRIEKLSLAKPIQASGKVSLRRAVSDSDTLIGFYNSKDSVTTNPSQSSASPQSFLGISVGGPSREGFLVSPTYRSSRQNNGRQILGPVIFPDGTAHEWTLNYEPKTGSRNAHLAVALDGKSTRLELPSDEIDDSTTFDRFGIVTAWIDGNGQHIYFDDLSYTCRHDR